MIEGESCATTSKVESRANRMNAQTQHGSEETADEENIVLYKKNFAVSPIRETDEVVWHEEFIEATQGDDDVSSISFFPINIKFPIIFNGLKSMIRRISGKFIFTFDLKWSRKILPGGKILFFFFLCLAV